MDPRLETRGSNYLGGAMFKRGAHSGALTSLPIGPAFLIRQKGRKKARSVKTITIMLMLKASPNYKAKVKTQSYIKGALCLR